MNLQSPIRSLLELATLGAALGSGLIAGVFFAFSSFVMPALGRILPPQGIAAMQAINVVVLNRSFLGVFVGTAAACLLLGVAAVINWSAPGAGLRLAASVLYLGGCFLVTRACNVPLNDGLAAVQPESAEGARVWLRYLVDWTLWNHVRGAAALAAAALFTLALVRQRALVGQLSAALLALSALAGCNANELHPIAPPGSSAPVTRLSELAVFEGDPAQQQPRAGFVAYDVNVALYADSAIKRRFIFVPEGTRVRTSADRWELPVGAYLVKTFGFPVDARDPSLGERLIETRFLVKTSDGFVASTYVWNDAQTDAIVSAGDLDVPVSWIDERGQSHGETFHVPGTSECASCHAGRALGWRSRQLDHAGTYADGTHDQIAHLAARGIIDGPPPSHAVLSDPFGGAPLAARARSYLDANCGHCHGAGGSAESTGLYWDFEHTAPESLPLCRSFGLFGGPALVPGQPEESGLIERMLASDSFSRMPRGPTRSPDREGIALLSNWISSLTPAGCP
jgi:uncharacterized repeat protein (TIGR03806 family)